MTPNKTRAGLAFLALLALIAGGVLAYFYGDKLNSVQLALLTMVLTKIADKVSSAFAYYFDGTPHTNNPSNPSPSAGASVPDFPPTTQER